MTFAGLLASCFRSGSPSSTEESLSSDGPRSSEASTHGPVGKGKIIYQENHGSKRSTTHGSSARAYMAPSPTSTHAQIQRILATANISPTGEGPLSTLSKASMHATCEGLDVPLGVVVFEDAENSLYSQQSSGLTGSGGSSNVSFEMQPDLWQFQFKVRCMWVNSAHAQALECNSCDKAMSQISASINKNTALRCDLLGLLKGIEHGQSQPIQTWNTYYSQGQHPELFSLWLQPCLWITGDGSKFIACLIYTEPQPSHQAILEAMAPDHTCLECIPSSVTTVNEDGFICTQNAAARASFGPSLSTVNERGVNFLQELFHGHQDLHAKMQRRLKRANSFHVCIQLLSPLLREWLNLVEAEEVWHQLYITRVTTSLLGSSPAYVIVQTDITDKVLAERKVAQLQHQHQGLLREILPPEVMEAILQSKCMVQAARQSQHQQAGSAAAAPCSDSHDLASCLDAPDDAEDSDPSPSTHRLAHQCSQLPVSGSLTQAHGGVCRGRRPSQLLQGSASQLNTQLSSLDISFHSKTPGLQDMKGVWLTQADVQNLATNHESVTILFADIKGFTALSQQLHPAEVMLFLNQLYSIWDAMLDSYGVYKVETIGDSYMVAGGLFSTDPVSKTQKLGGYDPRHAQKVVDFGRAMLESASLVLDPRGAPVQIRIGIHSGGCVSGIVGQRMPRFCLFGDTINTASRMESNCPRPGCIHASEASQALLPHEPWVPTGGVFCKGKGVMQSYYIPVTADPEPTPDEPEAEEKMPPLFLTTHIDSSLVDTGCLPLLTSGSVQAGQVLPASPCSSLQRPPSVDTCSSLQSTSCSSHVGSAAAAAAPPVYFYPAAAPEDAVVDEATPPRSSRPRVYPRTASMPGFSSSGEPPELARAIDNPIWANHAFPGGAPGEPGAEPPVLRVRAHITAHMDAPSADAAASPLVVFGSVVSETLSSQALSSPAPGSQVLGGSTQPQSTWIDCAEFQPQAGAGAPRPSSTQALTSGCSLILTTTGIEPGLRPSYKSVPLKPAQGGGGGGGYGTVLHESSLLHPVTPGQTSMRAASWKVSSYDGRAQAAPGQHPAHPHPQQQSPHTPRRSKITEQAQRVLQELNQSRPRPRELTATMSGARGVTFDARAGSTSEYSSHRGSMDVSRVNSVDCPRRGSLDLAWASVNRFRRSHSPGPAVLMEAADPADDISE